MPKPKKSDFAFAAVRLMLRMTLMRDNIPLPPAFVVRFLNEVWAPYLVRKICDTPTTAPMAGASRVTESLLLSLSRAPTRKQRKLLSCFIDRFLPVLRNALESSSWSEEERRSFLDHLAEWHLSILETGEPPAEPDKLDFSTTVPLRLLSPEYRHYLDCYEKEVEYIDLADIPSPWSPSALEQDIA